MNWYRITIISLALGILVSGCAVPLRIEELTPREKKHQFVKNYVIGKPVTVSVGEPMVKIQDYWVDIVAQPVAVANKVVNIKGGVVDITLRPDIQYPVRGRLILDGVDYMVVATSNNPSSYTGVLVRDDGSIHNKVVAAEPQINGVVVVLYEMSISDSTARLVREELQVVNSSNGYENYELVYTGINANGLSITYREFSPDGLARVAFFQNLSYEPQAKSITFKKHRISIEKATSESITFAITTDGH